jgi:hypothetical protein
MTASPCRTAPAGTTWTSGGRGTSTLADEHAQLLCDVRRRAESVQASAAAGTWPHAELATLTGFLRSGVLRQASDEEARLFPRDMSAEPFIALTADHGQLYELTEQLERAYADPCPVPELRSLLDRLIATLECHLAAEQHALAALVSSDDSGPVIIRLDVLPEAVAVRMCIERVLRLRPHERAEIYSRSRRQVREVCRWLHDFDAGRYGLLLTRAGDGETRLDVTRRAEG